MDLTQSSTIEIKDLCTFFYTDDGVVKAVNGINLNIYEGESLGIVGESGCGKSTLGFSIINLIQPPGKIVSGKVLYEGRNILNLPRSVCLPFCLVFL